MKNQTVSVKTAEERIRQRAQAMGVVNSAPGAMTGYTEASTAEARVRQRAQAMGVVNTGAGTGKGAPPLSPAGNTAEARIRQRAQAMGTVNAGDRATAPLYTEKTAAELEAPRARYEKAKADSETAKRYYRGLTERAAALDEHIRQYEAQISVWQTMGTPEAIAETQKLQTMLDAAYQASDSIKAQTKGFEANDGSARYGAGQILDDKALEQLRREAEADVAENYAKQAYYYGAMMQREGVTPERAAKYAQLREQAQKQYTGAQTEIRDSLMQYDPVGWMQAQGYSIAGLPGQGGTKTITAEQAKQLAAAAAQRAANAGNEADRAREEAFAKGILDNLYVFMTPEELRAQREALEAEIGQGERTANNMATERRTAQAAREATKAKKAELDKLNNALATQEAAQTIQATEGTETGKLIQEAVAYAYASTPEERAKVAKRVPYMSPDKTMNLENVQETEYEEYLRAIKRALKADGYDKQAIENTVETLRREFNAEWQRQQNESIDQIMSRSGFGGWLSRWGMTLASVPVNLISGVGMLAPVATALNGSDYSTVDPNSAWFGATNAVNSIRETHQKYNAGGKVNDMLYGIITSSMDSVLGGLVGSGITRGLGLTGKAAAWVGGSVIGAEAAAQSMQDIAARGGNVSQVLSGGLMAGAFETFFEQFSLAQLQGLSQIDLRSALADGKLWKTIAENVGKGMLTNGSEELFTELANVMYDTYTMGELSNYAESVERYMTWGLSEEEARKRTATDLANQVLEAGYTGALQGLLMDIGGLAVHGMDTWADPEARAQQAERDMEEWREGMRTFWRQDPDAVEQKNSAAPGKETTAVKGETAHVIEVLRNSTETLSQMDTVATASINDLNSFEGRTIAERARQLFERIKGVVIRPGLGEVEINGRSVKDDLSHGVGPAKAAVIKAIPAVIEHGKQVDFQQNWKGRAYDGYIFAAPVSLDGRQVYVAAVVKKTSKNRFYLHEVVDSDGNIIKIDNGDSANQTGLAAESDTGAKNPLSNDSIAQNPASSNTQNQGPNLRLPTLEEYVRQMYGDAGSWARGINMDAWRERMRMFYGEEATAEAETAGKPGLVRDSYVETTMDSGTAERLDQVAKALGLNVRFVDRVAGGMANSSIRGNQVLIEKGNPNPLNFLFGHEITHRLQELAPAQYQRFKELVANEADTRQDARETADNYRQKGLDLTDAGAMDEAVSDYAGRMLEDGQLLDNFIRRHSGERTLLETLRDAFRALLEKLRGGERRQAQLAVDRLNRALDTAAANAQSETAVHVDGKERYSVKVTDDGRSVAAVDSDILSHIDTTNWDADKKAQAKAAAKTALLAFKDGIQVNGIDYKVNRTSRREYTWSKYTERIYRKDGEMFADKMRAAANTDDIITATTNWANDGGLKHPRNDNFVDFAHGNVLIQAGKNQYEAETVVGITDTGEYVFYDVVDMQPTNFKTVERYSSTAAGTDAVSNMQENLSINSIRDGSEKINSKNFLKGTDHTRAGIERRRNGETELGRKLREAMAQADTQRELALAKSKLQSQYEAALTQARASGNADLANALYKELLRIQKLERGDDR